MIAVFNTSVRGYRQDATYEPISFRQFLAEGGNCTDYGGNSARAWNLMQGRNPKLEGVFWLPTDVYTFSGNQPTGHTINAIVNTRTSQATLVDLTNGLRMAIECEYK